MNVQHAESQCSACGAPMQSDWRFCKECGGAPLAMVEDDSRKGLAIALASGVAVVIVGIFFAVSFFAYPAYAKSQAEKRVDQALAGLTASTGIRAQNEMVNAEANNLLSVATGGPAIKSLEVSIPVLDASESQGAEGGGGSALNTAAESVGKMLSSTGDRGFLRIRFESITVDSSTADISGTEISSLGKDFTVVLSAESSWLMSQIESQYAVSDVVLSPSGDSVSVDYTDPYAAYDYYSSYGSTDSSETALLGVTPDADGAAVELNFDGSTSQVATDPSGCLKLMSTEFEDDDGYSQLEFQGRRDPPKCERWMNSDDWENEDTSSLPMGEAVSEVLNRSPF